MKIKVMLCMMFLVSVVCAGVAFAGTEGNSNTFYGSVAGNSTTGDDDLDTFIGSLAGYSNTAGASDTYVGGYAGYWSQGTHNTFIGASAGFGEAFSGNAGNNNTFIGATAGNVNNSGNDNTFVGHEAGMSNSSGHSNTFIGRDAGASNTTAGWNTFIGWHAGADNDTGGSNTFVGHEAGRYNTDGNYNTFIGEAAGVNNTGSGNVFIGRHVGENETGSSKLYIDNGSTTTPLIYGDFSTDTLTVNGTLGIGTTTPTQKLHVNGQVLANGQYLGQYAYPGFWLDETGAGNKGLYYVLDSKSLQIQRRAQNFGAFEATVMHVFIEAPANSFYLASNGYLGLGRAPGYPIHHSNGARLSTGGVWTDASSRDYKENIESLTSEKATEALKGLNPVTFNYKADSEEKYAGFIAEDVPEIVATNDRKGLSPMDIVAVLTKVAQEQQKIVQEQQKTIAELTRKVDELQREMSLKGVLATAVQFK